MRAHSRRKAAAMAIAGMLAGFALIGVGPAEAALAPAQPYDFNGDGFVNPDDLSDYITVFFAG